MRFGDGKIFWRFSAMPELDDPVRMIRQPLAMLFASFALALTPGCGGGGSSSSGGSTSADILLTDAPTDELLSFNITVDEVRLYRAGGGRSENLLTGNVRVDVLRARTQLAWLVSKAVPAGTWAGLELRFDPLSVDARLLDGSQALVTVLTDELTANFSTPVVFAADGYQRCVVDFDLDQSLTGDGASGFILEPVGNSTGSDDATTPIVIDDITGRVKAVDTLNNLITIDAWADDDRSVLLGSLQIAVETTDLLQDQSGTPFVDRASFYESLTPDASIIEVHGSMAGGIVDASRIEVEDESGGDMVVRLRGVVIGVSAPGSFLTLAIAEVKKGFELVEAVEGEVPANLMVHWDLQTVFFTADGSPVTAGELAIGAKVDVRFLEFDGHPLTAARIELESEGGEYEGIVSDDSGIPTSFVLTLQPLSPALQSGEVNGPITVDLSGQHTVTLDAGVQPVLSAHWIQSGQRVRAQGPLGGPTPSTREITADEITLKPGRLDASVIGGLDFVDALEIYAIIEEIEDPFGASADMGGNPMVIVLPECVFVGDITDYETFAAAMNDAENYPVLDIEVRGIADPTTPEAVIAYEIEVSTD
jgi:hypothetical protein